MNRGRPKKGVAVGLIAFLLVLMFSPFACAAPLKEAQTNYVSIFAECEDGDTWGSGFAISKHRAITATHMTDCPFFVKNELGKVLYVRDDFAIVEFPDADFTPNVNWTARTGKKLKQGDKVFALSNGFLMDGGYIESRVALINDEGITVQPCFPMGSSGSGVYAENGKLVGIVSMVRSDGITCIGLVIPIDLEATYRLMVELPDGVSRAIHPER